VRCDSCIDVGKRTAEDHRVVYMQCSCGERSRLTATHVGGASALDLVTAKIVLLLLRSLMPNHSCRPRLEK
jgi:hypothetical protein